MAQVTMNRRNLNHPGNVNLEKSHLGQADQGQGHVTGRGQGLLNLRQGHVMTGGQRMQGQGHERLAGQGHVIRGHQTQGQGHEMIEGHVILESQGQLREMMEENRRKIKRKRKRRYM